jgi:hypothetical protein
MAAELPQLAREFNLFMFTYVFESSDESTPSVVYLRTILWTNNQYTLWQKKATFVLSEQNGSWLCGRFIIIIIIIIIIIFPLLSHTGEIHTVAPREAPWCHGSDSNIWPHDREAESLPQAIRPDIPDMVYSISHFYGDKTTAIFLFVNF